MAELPSLPLYTDAYLGDTQHLTLEEHGAYTRLLMIHWRMLPDHLPDDDARIARMLGVSVGRWRKLKPTICDGKLYAIRDGKMRQKRLEKEWRACFDKKQKAADAASSRWNAKHLENNETDHADASPEHMPEPMPTPCLDDALPSPSPIREEQQHLSTPTPREPDTPERRAARRLIDVVSVTIQRAFALPAWTPGDRKRPAMEVASEWAKIGVTPERLREIVDPVVARCVEQRDAPKALAYFDAAVRMAMLGSATATAACDDLDTVERWERRVRRWGEGGDWSPYAGLSPPPDDPACRARAFPELAGLIERAVAHRRTLNANTEAA